MKRVTRRWVAFALLAVFGWSDARAQDDGARPFCDDNDPQVTCTDSSFEVVFPLGGAFDTSVFEYSEFQPGAAVDVAVVLDGVEDGIQGWSYAVKNDESFLELDPASVTTAGTVVDDVFTDGFNVTEAVDGGFISGVVLSQDLSSVLPVGRQVVGRARYTLVRDAGPQGTRLEFADEEIGPNGSPPTAIEITVDGNEVLPLTLTDGIVRRLEIDPEDCENGIDDDGDGLVDLDDPDCVECDCPEGQCRENALYFGDLAIAEDVDATGADSFVISSRNARSLLGFQFGVEIRPEGGSFAYEFSSSVGTDEDRLVEVLMTDDRGDSVTPDTPNRLISDIGGIFSVERGSALEGLEGGDFLEFDVEPGVGGPGFFVGYVSDLDDNVNRIPATDLGGPEGCPVNELLIVRLGAPDCPGFGLFFGTEAVAGEVDATGAAQFSISTRNARPLLGFQFGVETTESPGGLLYEFSDDLGTDPDRLVEVLMTDDQGNSIRPATPNTIVASDVPVVSVERGPAIAGFSDGDFLSVDLQPGVGGPGFFVGYVSDMDGNENQIPATSTDEGCPLNEVLIVRLEIEPACPNFGYVFGPEAAEGTVDARGSGSFVISSRNASPLLGFQLGVAIRPEGDAFRYSFAGNLGTDDDRLIELLMTTDNGDSVTPQAVNELLADGGAVASIERGEAIEAFEGGDFLDFDLDPGVGGPGLFVGYVSDLDDNANVIPATGPSGDDCPLNELLVVRLGEGVLVCPDFGYFFGPEPVSGTVDIENETSFAISSRNASPLLGFQLGVSVRPDGDDFRYVFADDLGTDDDRLIELLMTDDQGDSITPRAANELLAATGSVISVERGAATAAFEGGDFLDFDLDPGVGGPGFFAGYVTDLDDNANVIPATPERQGDVCPLNELLVVTIAGAGNQPFVRSDADGNGRFNVSDAVIIIQVIFGNQDVRKRFECDDALDGNDDEQLDVVDALPILAWLFQMGPDLPDPFPACGVDATDDGPLGCLESNCP